MSRPTNMSGRSVDNPAPATVISAVERSRTYRTPPSMTASSAPPCDLISAEKRPDHGLRGELVNLLVNWFRIKYDRTRIFIYKVVASEEPRQQPSRGRGRGRGRGGGGGPSRPPPPITHPPTIAKILWQTVRDYRDLFPNRHRLIFDDNDQLFTPDKIAMSGKELTLHCTHPEKEGKRVNVLFECFTYFDLDLKGDPTSNTNYQWTSIFLKTLLSQNTRYVPPENADQPEKELSQRFAHFDGGSFFVPRTPNAPKIEIEPGVDAWLGLYASVRRMENFCPVINYGLVNKLFYKLNLDLINFYLNIENNSTCMYTAQNCGLNRASCMTPAAAHKFNEKLQNLGLKCDCVPGKDKDGLVVARVELHFRFVRLKEDTSASREFMRVEDNTAAERVFTEIPGRDGRSRKIWKRWRDVRMDNWYAAQGRPLNYPNLPLCIVKMGKTEHLLPMEVLLTSDKPQKFIKMLSFYARMRITKELARTPILHHRYTNRLITDKLEYGSDPFLKAMNISFDPKMIECEGRRLEPCTVLGKSESDEKLEKLEKLEVSKDKGDFFLKRAVETSNKQIRFVVYRLTDAVDKLEMKEFYQELVKKAVARGFNVPERDYSKPPIIEDQRMDRSDPRRMARMIQKTLDMFDKSGKTDDEVLVFLFFTRMFDELYGEIKYLCDILQGVVSQVIDVDTVKKACMKSTDVAPSDYKSIYHHLCLKLNAKLGGVNQIVAETESEQAPSYGRMPSNERTMFIGIDVIHPSPNSPIRDCSLAAIVASMDRNAAKYAVRIKVNTRCNETVQQFDEHFSFLLAKYHSLNGFFPERIVILRDGVSDGEMIKAASVEINSIKYAWNKSASGVKCPPISYIVAQKRHKTRFYQRPTQEKGDVSNPPMGTVVDKEVVTPHMFDFYMIPHFTALGTSRPIHYTVVYDEWEYDGSQPVADAVQELLFRLSFLYARCSRPVSLPSPVYYAHLACERAAFQHQYAVRTGDVMEILDKAETESDQDYATRVGQQVLRIEEKLQVSEKHPGMYFI